MLFAREPRAGRVKTRLQPRLTPGQAAELYTAFLRDCAEALAASVASLKIVAVEPPEAESCLRSLLGAPEGLAFEGQPGGPLGERLEALCRRAVGAGCGRVVLLGSDSPSLTPWSIDESLRRLRSADVVIGPSVDGGYYLIGLRAEALPSAAPAVFQGIEWGTGRVLEQTLAALPGGLRLSLMPPWYDVDVPEEAAFLRVHLEALARSGDDTTASHSRAALRGLDLPPPGYRPMMR
ncbi:MAG: TIGR04282 family arsenosugar biosynthesis glycosyltransferase [Gemmatimonadaceae bacterium]|nr:TIGR04282 family arsenosugar biosynthesis glycosyltransferase [Gemmatimonadaceae bacterium]